MLKRFRFFSRQLSMQEEHHPLSQAAFTDQCMWLYIVCVDLDNREKDVIDYVILDNNMTR
jgi:hypothetical protein